MASTDISGLTRASILTCACLSLLFVQTPRPTAAQALAGASTVGTLSPDGHTRFVALNVGKSLIIDLPRETSEVLVADPKIANAVVRTAQRAYIIGLALGQTNVIFFDAGGRQIAAYDIAVTRDLGVMREALKQTLPNSKIRIEGLGDGVNLLGSVATPVEAQQAGDLAARLVGGSDKVTNNIAVRGRDQVMLKVVVAEVQRDIVKQMGIDLSVATSAVTYTNANPFTALGHSLVSSNATTLTGGGITATLRAMESTGVVRTLAEPNLTAISGETATFLAGGEFPVPAGYSCDPSTHVCSTQISFKKFGIALNFTPVVMTEGRISLRVMTEVSEISNDNAITLTQAVTSTTTNSLTVPSIKTRRAETTLEIPSGGSVAMAGLIQEQTKQAMSGMPGLAQLPILGSLFRSRDYVNRNSELMVMITPYIVRAVTPKELSRPDDGFTVSGDRDADLLGTINKIYGAPGTPKIARKYYGNFGFITD